MFHTYVASVLSECCVCCNDFQAFFQVFFTSVSEACFKYFICLQTYVASITSGCFKSRSGLAHVAMSSPAVVARGGTRGRHEAQRACGVKWSVDGVGAECMCRNNVEARTPGH
jgi:hypothetical protein